MKLFQTNTAEIVRSSQESFYFEHPNVLLTKRTEKLKMKFHSCIKFVHVTCNKKVNTVNIFICFVL